MHKALVKPHLDYCDVAWSPSSSKLITQLEKVQKLATRIILQASSTVRTAELYHTLKWQSLDQHKRVHTVLYVFKVLNNLVPIYLCNSHLHVPVVRTNHGKNSFYYRGATIWNSIDKSLYPLSNIVAFKSNRNLYFSS